VWKASPPLDCSVILNGADTTVFNPRGYRPWDGVEPLRLVTHHWGGNWMKGFDMYQRLDEMLGEERRAGRIEFSYVGNLPPGFRFRNARHVAPLTGTDLADELRSHHVYVTASINEPGSNHQNEGALCGLPLIYRNSGCLPEYCNGYGESFEAETFEAALERIMVNYDRWRAAMPSYPHTAERSCRQYLALFVNLLARREDIAARRNVWRSPASFLFNQLPV
jgi:hypothetical protein